MQFSKGNGALKCFYGTIIKYSPHISAQWSMKAYIGMLLWLELREIFLHFLIEKFTFWFDNKKSHPNLINCCMIIIVRTGWSRLWVCFTVSFFFKVYVLSVCTHAFCHLSYYLPGLFFLNLSNLNFYVIKFLKLNSFNFYVTIQYYFIVSIYFDKTLTD